MTNHISVIVVKFASKHSILNHQITLSMWSNNLYFKLTGVLAMSGIMPNITNKAIHKRSNSGGVAKKN